MPTQVICPSCQAKLKVPDQRAGKALRCPRCKTAIPANAEASEAITGQPTPAAVAVAVGAEGEPLDVVPLDPEERAGGGGMALGLILAGVAAAVLLGIGLLVGVGVLGYWLVSASPAPAGGGPTVTAQAGPAAANDAMPVGGNRGADLPPNIPNPNPPPGPPPGPAPGPPADPPPPPVPPLKLPPPEDRLPIQPATVAKETSYKLPERVASLRVGGGGRFLILHFPEVGKLGVFDANAAKIVRYISAPGDEVHFAGGMNKLVVYLPGSKVLQRYDLLTGNREKSGPFALPEGKIEAFCMGHASAGPLLVGVERHGAGLYDIGSFKEIPLPVSDRIPGFPRIGGVPRLEGGNYWAGATGRVFGHTGNWGMPNGVNTLVLAGGKIEKYHEHKGTWFVVPGPDDKHVYAGGHGVVSDRVTPVPDVPYSMEGNSGQARHLYLPAHHGPFYLHAQTIENLAGLGGGIPQGTIRLFVLGDKEPFATYPDTAVCKYGWKGLAGLGIEHSIHLIPRAKLLVVVPESRDELRLYPADLEAALKKSARDYLIYTSTPPTGCSTGQAFTYQAEVMANQQPVTYRLESGPEGMTVSPEGLVRWEVPAGMDADRVSVILAARSAGGQEAFQTFTLAVQAK